MDCSPPGSSVHGILQARILETIAIPFSRESSWPRDWIRVSSTAGQCFTIWATGAAQKLTYMFTKEKSSCNWWSLSEWRCLQTFWSQSLVGTFWFKEMYFRRASYLYLLKSRKLPSGDGKNSSLLDYNAIHGLHMWNSYLWIIYLKLEWGLSLWLSGKESPVISGDVDSISDPGRSHKPWSN